MEKKRKSTSENRLHTAFDYKGFYGSGEQPKTHLELRLMCLSQEIRAKPEWYKKVEDKKILEKWRDEASDNYRFSCNYREFRYVIQELKEYYAKLIDLPILPAPVDGVYQADHLIDEALKKKFMEEVAVLENVPEDQLDWHPGSDKQVLDLVHPSLFCFVNQVSRSIPRPESPLPWHKFIGSGTVTSQPKPKKKKRDGWEDEEVETWSKKFQWLPAEFRVDSNGKVTIESYINNLHPHLHKNLYGSIASICEKFVPLFNKVITDLLNPLPDRIPPEIVYERDDLYYFQDSEEEKEGEIDPNNEDEQEQENEDEKEEENEDENEAMDESEENKEESEEDNEEEQQEEADEPVQAMEDEDNAQDNEDQANMDNDIMNADAPDSEEEAQPSTDEEAVAQIAVNFWSKQGKNFERSGKDSFQERTLKFPEVPKKYESPLPHIETFDLKGRTLQVIVKIAEILLTPEKPKYDGGAWHIEGMENERIVATGIYYFTSENITQSILEFRRSIREPDYEQNDDWGVKKVFGMKSDDPLNQPAGFVITQQDRCIAFPNLYQHHVANFKLKDKTKPGFRKILVFFLVDPTTPIVSTATVPPQQKSWFELELKTRMKGTYLEKIPKPVLDEIISYLDWPMDLEEAKKHREELMKERKFFVKENNEKVFERPFSLCEH